MPLHFPRRAALSGIGAVLFGFVSLHTHAADINARIKGTVTDAAGAVVPRVMVIAVNSATGVKFTTLSQANGEYQFQQLPIGTYTVSATAAGFKSFSAAGIVLNIDQEYVEAIKLDVGSTSETIAVEADAAQVNTTEVQLSNVVDTHQITELPLIGRAFTSLEQILPGVQASDDRFGSTFSVNGSQPQQSSYIINGADSNDLPLNTIAIQPNVDALQEFNLITGPLNAEYDRNSGAVVSTAIKEGTNSFHGDAFEFYRDTFLNTRNYFQKLSPTATFHQNVFGGTVGGPILKDKFFFFGAYQGTRQAVPEAGGNVNVFTPTQLTGNFATDLPTAQGTRPVGNAGYGNFAGNQIPGTIVIPGCTTQGNPTQETYAQCAYDNKGVFPATAFNPISTTLLSQFNVPSTTSGSYTFNPTVVTGIDQGIGRFDFNPTARDQFYFVGIYQQQKQTETLPFTGATLPGFGDMSTTVIHQFSAGYVRQLSSTMVNDFEVHYTRFNLDTVEPQHVVAPSSLGFSITPQNQAASSVPTVAISNLFTLGFSTNGPQPRLDQVYQVDNNLSKTIGRHNFKVGYDGRKYTVENPFFARNSGSYSFSTSSNPETSGDAGLDYLLGAPASYSQGSGARIDAYAFLNYLYAQDTWKATNDLTLSYGLGYQIDTPLHNLQFGGIGVTCFIPGQQSKVFTTAPLNLNYPGDPGCNNASGATTRFGELGPRLGFNYAPNLGFLSAGESKKLSINAGFGIYYNRSEEETSLQNLSDPPFGQNSAGAPDAGVATNPGFANPYQDLNTGATIPNAFPFVPPTAGSSPNFLKYPSFDLSQYSAGFRSPYSENFQLTVERELPAKAVLRVSYVGTFGRRNQVTLEGNPITQAGHDACLADATCRTTFRNTQPQQYPGHTQFGIADLARGAGPTGKGLNDYKGIGEIASEGSSNYNALQVSVDKGLSHGLQLQASYTLSHALDNASSFEGSGFGGANGRGFNQYKQSLNYGNSSFDARHRFVLAPVYTIPFKRGTSAFSPLNLALSGWEVSAISTFATGFPYDISYGGGTSLSLYCASGSSYYACPDVPVQVAPLVKADPRSFFVNSTGVKTNRTVAFQPGSFAPEPLGSFGNVARNAYHGFGINNTNFIIAKNFSVSSDGARYIQIRMESDNVFNHTQFLNPNGSISGVTFNAANGITNQNTLTFGQVTAAAAARQTQLAAKIYF